MRKTLGIKNKLFLFCFIFKIYKKTQNYLDEKNQEI